MTVEESRGYDQPREYVDLGVERPKLSSKSRRKLAAAQAKRERRAAKHRGSE